MKISSILLKITITLGTATLLCSCSPENPNSPGWEYMPDMYRSPSYETNLYIEKDGDTLPSNRLPVAGTIPRGHMPYMYVNNFLGYDSAGKFLKNPLPHSLKNLTEGEALYGKYCVHCHGAEGNGDGPVGNKLPGPPPPYSGPALKDLPEGKVYHSITYGKGLMGPHGNLLSEEERWKLVHYVQKLQKPAAPASGTPGTGTADTAASVNTVTAAAEAAK